MLGKHCTTELCLQISFYIQNNSNNIETGSHSITWAVLELTVALKQVSGLQSSYVRLQCSWNYRSEPAYPAPVVFYQVVKLVVEQGAPGIQLVYIITMLVQAFCATNKSKFIDTRQIASKETLYKDKLIAH